MEPTDGLLQAIASDEAHRVKRPAVGVGADTIDRDDARVLETAGDLGFDEKPAAARGVVGKPVVDLLERDLAVESVSSATKTAPRPPLACGRRTRNRWPFEEHVPTERVERPTSTALSHDEPCSANILWISNCSRIAALNSGKRRMYSSVAGNSPCCSRRTTSL